MNIVVTGATKGIGRAIIELFASKGFDVAFNARSAADVEAFSAELEAQYPDIEIIAECADMSDKAAVLAFTDSIKDRWGKVDVLVNNAGTFTPGKVSEEPDGSLEHLINTNLYSAYYVTRELLDLMKPHRQGHIFNMCSVASFKAYANGGSYAISKFALLGFSKQLREEMKEFNIRVTSLMPGATFTASWEAVTDLPQSRFMDVQDIAELVYTCFSLSERTVVEDIVLRPMQGDI